MSRWQEGRIRALEDRLTALEKEVEDAARRLAPSLGGRVFIEHCPKCGWERLPAQLTEKDLRDCFERENGYPLGGGSDEATA